LNLRDFPSLDWTWPGKVVVVAVVVSSEVVNTSLEA
jgi:hypothetical protein